MCSGNRAFSANTTDQSIIERRHVAVLLGAGAPESQALRACTHSASAPAVTTGVGERAKGRLRVLFVDAQAAFDGDRQRDRRLRSRDHLGHELRLAHQARGRTSRLHAVRGTADVKIDLTVAEVGGDCGCGRDLGRLRAAAELDRHGHYFLGVEPEQAGAVAADRRRRP